MSVLNRPTLKGATVAVITAFVAVAFYPFFYSLGQNGYVFCESLLVFIFAFAVWTAIT